MSRALLFAAATCLLAMATPALSQAQRPLPPEEETEHVVKPGETLGGIAVRAKVPRVLIAEANGLAPPYAVRAGQKLLIPRTRRHKVARGETGFSIAYNYGVPWSAIAVANGLDQSASLRTGQTLLIPTVLRPDTGAAASPAPSAPPAPSPAPAADAAASAPAGPPTLVWPLAGTVRRGFTPRGQRNHHDGLDIPAPSGTAVRSVAAGKVLFAGSEPQQFGNLVVVDHGNGWHSAYAFLSRMTVKVGDDVRQGERVGLVGNTGRARGNELHFELRQGNRPVDPAERLPKRD